MLRTTGDQDAAISAIGLTELVHGVFRTPPETRERATSFLNGLLSALVVYPFTTETAFLAGRIDAEQRSKGVIIPFSDLLIGATALSLGYSVLTLNVRDFERIPGLKVAKLDR